MRPRLIPAIGAGAVLLVLGGSYLWWRPFDADHELRAWHEQTAKANRAEESRLLHLVAEREMQFGPAHPFTVASVQELGSHYAYRGLAEKARPLLERALAAHDAKAPSSDLADLLASLALVERLSGNRAAARPLLHRALEAREKALGAESVWVAGNLHSLGDFYAEDGDRRRAEGYFRRALAIAEKAQGHERAEHFRSMALEGLARLSRQTGSAER